MDSKVEPRRISALILLGNNVSEPAKYTDEFMISTFCNVLMLLCFDIQLTAILEKSYYIRTYSYKTGVVKSLQKVDAD